MKTKFFGLLLIAILLFSCKTTVETFQTDDANKIGVKSNKFCGTVFKAIDSGNLHFIQPFVSLDKFTPTREDIQLAEAILKTQIESINSHRINQFGKQGYIDKHLNKYFRQYIGFINEQGDHVIHINFHWNRFSIFDRLKGNWDDRLNYTSDFSIVLDGGSRYWNVNVNLTTKKLSGLSVNGVG